MNIPTEADWCREKAAGCLDRAHAFNEFNGMSFEAAVRYFGDGRMHTEALMYMPYPVFAFYFRAYLAHIVSIVANDDYGNSAEFLGLVEFQAEHTPEFISPLWTEIEPVLKLIVDHQDPLDGEAWTSDGSFRVRIQRNLVARGFEVTFDTSGPEIVPPNVTVAEWSTMLSPLSWPMVFQILRNSGYKALDSSAGKNDILRVLGPPDVESKPDQAWEWIRYDRFGWGVHFQLEGDSIVGVSLMQVEQPIFAPQPVDPQQVIDDLLKKMQDARENPMVLMAEGQQLLIRWADEKSRAVKACDSLFGPRTNQETQGKTPVSD